MKDKETLVIRADADARAGTGHLMRCLALAEAWQDAGGEAIFVSACAAPSLKTRLETEGFRIIHPGDTTGTLFDARETTRIAREEGAVWIVVDGYQFGGEYQRAIKDSGLSLLFIDDYGHADHYYADIVLNQNVYADMSFYPAYEPSTRFLLGTKYALLRREFLNWPGRSRDCPETARKILITLGGSDPENVTLKVLEAVKAVDADGLEVTAVMGGANPHFDRIHEVVKDRPGFRLVENAMNMPELMAWADCAISAGGSTCWELLYMGVPSIVIPIAENQEPVARELRALQIALVPDKHTLNDPGKFAGTIAGFLQSKEVRRGLAQRMARYIDGHGPARAIDAIHEEHIALRRAAISDCRMIWQWINDPPVRAVSFSPGPISLERHREWFSSALVNPDLVYYIAVDREGTPFGQARFLVESGEATISMLVGPGHRGKSLGSALIRDATETFFRETGIGTVKAFIKTGNEVSRKAFARAGYTSRGLRDHQGEPAYLFMKCRGR
ncbi:MAG: UDP-2,4-diacetamido-2,4,6-trideoxy-beta-L-altropyranose hydrolase [Methanoregula sp.]|nr:UDP-2,4-diacetamido-2,4,6-trideoxy-beta-L-altropyranose hydrolase [Methanoregula sp.]